MNPSSRAVATRPSRIVLALAVLGIAGPAWTGDTIAAPLPERGRFTFPAPYGTEGIRITGPADCGGSDCVEPLRGLTGRNIDAHRGRATMLVLVGLRGMGPTLFRVHKATGQVESLGPVFDAASPVSRGSAAQYFSARRPGVLYVTRGARLLRYDVATRAYETVFDAATEFGPDRDVVDTHTSDGDDVHAALLRDTGTGAALGCVAYREDPGRFFFQPASGTVGRCLVEPGGRRLIVEERPDGSAGVETRAVDLETGVDTLVPDVAALGLGSAPTAAPVSRRHTCEEVRTAPHAGEVTCAAHNGSFRVVLAPSLRRPVGDVIVADRGPVGNLDVTGRYFVWVGHTGSRRDAYVVKMPEDVATEGHAVAASSSPAGAPKGAAPAAPAALSNPPSSAVPDPLRLPVATTAHVPLTAAYNALNVPGLAAGGSYLDPTTSVRIYKLTSATFPTASANWGHDYSEGGDEVSLPYNGETRAILARRNGGTWFLVDFTPGVGVGNPRALAGTLAPFMDLAFTFSNNPATPYYAYVSGGSTIRRIDIRSMTEAPGGGWPVTGETSAMWLHQSENDSFFTWMRGSNGSTVVGYQPATGTRKTYTNAGLNEPRIDRAGRYVGISMTSPYNGLVVWDWLTNSVLWTTSGDPGIPFAHNASLRRRWMSVDWNMSYPPEYTQFSSDVPNSAERIGGPANADLNYGNGNWIQYPASLDDQWAAFSYYGGLRPPESYWLAPGATVLITANGQRRILMHPYNTSRDYLFYPFAKFSPDGKYILFTSNMNGAARSDLFLAELPVAAAPDSTPPAVAITAPANGSTVAGSPVAVSADASDNVGVVGVQFELDGADLGGEDLSAPYGVLWNTLLTGNGTHTLTAVARDAAGNSTTSLPITVTVDNVDGVPPVISAVAASGVTATGATVTWTTDEPADSQVEYGTTTAYGSMTVLAPALVLDHAQTLGGLAPATVYHYRVRSRDGAGNLALSADSTFTTLGGGSDLIAHWKLDEGSGSVTADSSGNGHTGSLVGGAAWTPGRIGQAVVLDGVDDHVSAAHAADENAFPLTVAVWFKTTTTTGARGVVNKYRASSFNGYQVFLKNGNVCAWYVRDLNNSIYDGTNCLFSVPGFNDGLWHHAAFVVDASGGTLYVDGTARGQRAWTGTPGPVTTLEPVHLGHYPGATAGTEFLPGAVDDVRLYNRALTAAEVAQLHAGAPGDTLPPAISAVAASAITTTGATVTWTTDEPSDSQAEYGPTTAYGTMTALDPVLVTAHVRGITGLTPSTLYHYRVRSRDAAGNLAVSGDFTFTTAAMPVPGPVAHWKLNDGSGILAVDSSGNGRTGRLFNGPVWVPGRLGGALALDGVNDYVLVPHAARLNAYPLTAAVWFRTTSNGGTRGLLGKYVASSFNGYQMFFRNDKVCAWYFRNSANRIWDGGNCTLSASGYNDGAWHHAVLVVDAAGGRLYVDAVLKASRGWTGTPGAPTTTQDLRAGHYPGVNGAYMPGSVDDIQIHDRAFTAAEVAALYNSSASPRAKDPGPTTDR